MKRQVKTEALALFAVPFVFLASGCTQECVDLFDCADKAKETGQAMTCVANKCTPATPSNTGGGAGGGGGETGGGAGGGGEEEDAGTGGGGGEEDAGTGGGGGVVVPPLDFVASLSGAQAVPVSSSTETGSGTFTLTDQGDGGFEFAWNVTHTLTGAVTGEFNLDLAGFPGRPWFSIADAGSPVIGSRIIPAAEFGQVLAGATFLSLQQGSATEEVRGQIVPAGHDFWAARLDLAAPSTTTFGGAQLLVPLDGGAVIYAGGWTLDVDATQASIQQGGAAETNGPVVVDLTLQGNAASGTFPQATLIAGDTDGGLYVNVRTTDAGDGLLRGQLTRY